MHRSIFTAFAVTAILSAAVFSSTEVSAQETGAAGIAEQAGDEKQQAGETETAAKKWGIIDFSVSHLRQAPDYESPLETQELMGTVVEIVGEQGYWLQIRTPQPYTAWCTDMGVHRADEAEIEEWISSRRYIVTSPHSAIYSDRTNRSDVVCDLVEGDIVRAVLGKPQPRVRSYGLPIRKNGWAKVQTPSGKTGWVRTVDVRDFHKWASENTAAADNATAGKTMTGKTDKKAVGKTGKKCEAKKGGKERDKAERKSAKGNVAKGNAAKKDKTKKNKAAKYEISGCTAMEKAVAETAMRFIGTPYLWGGMSPDGFDCSGLVRFSYFMNGLMLPRNADQMALCGRPVPVFREAERTFCADSLRVGDLLFFGRRGADGAKDRITHVGIYIGNGRMVHSSQIVRVNSLVPGEPDFYENAGRLLSAVRIIGHEKETRDDLFRVDRVFNSICYFR